jgi:hypothetical protein
VDAPSSPQLNSGSSFEMPPRSVTNEVPSKASTPTWATPLLTAFDCGRYFETHVAPLLAKQCLDCHDWVTKDGALDLTRKMAALAVGTIVPSNRAKSSLWMLVTIAVSNHEMARRAFDLLAERLNEARNRPTENVLIDGRLIVRGLVRAR